MADVFLSYSQKDRASVERVAAGLKSLGFSVWYDARLESGDSFDEVIYTELHAAKSVLVCWSPDSMASKWPRSEAMIAYDKHKLAAAFLRACELRPPFNLVQTSDLSDWTGEPGHAGWRAVIRGLGTLCGRPGVGALAEALAAGTQEAVAEWAKQYPDESLAGEIWDSRRAHLRMEFATAFQAARNELAEALEKRRLDAETALTRATEDFETWLDTERLGKSGARPDPTGIVRRAMAVASTATLEAHAQIGRLEAELAAANQRAAAALRDRDAAVARGEQAVGMREDSIRTAKKTADAAAQAQVEATGSSLSAPPVSEKAAEPGAPAVPTAWEKRARCAGWGLLVAVELPGLISDLSKSEVHDTYFILAFFMWVAGTALLGISIYAKRKRRPGSKAALLRAIALGAIAMIAVPVFFDLVSKSQAGPFPYTLASTVVVLGAFGLALVGASVVALARRRYLAARKTAPNVMSDPATGKV